MDSLVSLTQQLSEQQVKDFAEDLDRVKDRPEDALKILKLLATSTLQPEWLKTTGIGKRLTAVTTNPEHYYGDQELLKQVENIKDDLKKAWNQLYKSLKKQIKK